MLVATLVLLSCLPLTADEGYWLFSDPPVKAITEKYGFTPSPDWLNHLRGAAVRIGGGSGSFVSADGLVITNHHIGEGQLHSLSTPQHNYERDGFLARTRQEELSCRGLEMLVLQHTENVTARVQAAVKPGATPAEAEAAHKAITAAIEKESFERTGLTSEVVTLFGGARFDLYQYKKYPDVKLVFAPEGQTAFFGGDPDNFEFPRYDLDVCFFRIYDHGEPLHTPDYLKFNAAGPAKGDLVFIAGHPGLSQLLVTMDELAYQRELRLPRTLEELHRLEHKLAAYSASSPEHARQAREAVFGVANSRKANTGFLAGLRNPGLLRAKAAEEERFRDSLAQESAQKETLAAYAQIRDAIAADRENFNAYQGYERFANRSDLMNMALTLVRAAAEREKPNGERLPAYRESALPSLEFRLFSGRPFYPGLEMLFLADGFENLVQLFGANDPLVKKLLAGKSPEARAKELVGTTKLESVAYRKKLYAGGEHAILHCDDPMIAIAAALDPSARAARLIDDRDDETKRRAYATIYQARVALNRAPAYPDATGTLRLAFGTVTGWEEGGKTIDPLTDFAGLYARAAAHDDQAPFDLMPKWVEHKSALDLRTPFNFAATADILGGNSGSPVVNRAGEFVGIIFDGNEPSLAGRYVYDPTQNRSVAVDSAAILEALRKVYGAEALAKELKTGRSH